AFRVVPTDPQREKLSRLRRERRRTVDELAVDIDREERAVRDVGHVMPRVERRRVARGSPLPENEREELVLVAGDTGAQSDLEDVAPAAREPGEWQRLSGIANEHRERKGRRIEARRRRNLDAGESVEEEGRAIGDRVGDIAIEDGKPDLDAIVPPDRTIGELIVEGPPADERLDRILDRHPRHHRALRGKPALSGFVRRRDDVVVERAILDRRVDETKLADRLGIERIVRPSGDLASVDVVGVRAFDRLPPDLDLSVARERSQADGRSRRVLAGRPRREELLDAQLGEIANLVGTERLIEKRHVIDATDEALDVVPAVANVEDAARRGLERHGPIGLLAVDVD